ncbi:MAG: PEGA domain-containing protein [Gammaproteobacteria bacterium]|jgi:hypothetical protein
MLKATGLVILAVFSLSGCSDSAVKQEGPADVTSSPTGASVYANGEKLGITPLHYRLYKAFPAGWKDMMFQAQGVLMVKMDGCEDYKLNVNDYILSKPIHAELKCDGADKSVLQAPVQQDTGNISHQRAIFSRGEVEARLKKLESLYQDRVITEEEYKATRKRILDEL